MRRRDECGHHREEGQPRELQLRAQVLEHLLAAAWRGDVLEVRRLLAAANVDVNQGGSVRGFDGSVTPLFVACCGGHLEVVATLLAAGARRFALLTAPREQVNASPCLFPLPFRDHPR